MAADNIHVYSKAVEHQRASRTPRRTRYYNTACEADPAQLRPEGFHTTPTQPAHETRRTATSATPASKEHTALHSFAKGVESDSASRSAISFARRAGRAQPLAATMNTRPHSDSCVGFLSGMSIHANESATPGCDQVSDGQSRWQAKAAKVPRVSECSTAHHVHSRRVSPPSPAFVQQDG